MEEPMIKAFENENTVSPQKDDVQKVTIDLSPKPSYEKIAQWLEERNIQIQAMDKEREYFLTHDIHGHLNYMNKNQTLFTITTFELWGGTIREIEKELNCQVYLILPDRHNTDRFEVTFIRLCFAEGD